MFNGPNRNPAWRNKWAGPTTQHSNRVGPSFLKCVSYKVGIKRKRWRFKYSNIQSIVPLSPGDRRRALCIQLNSSLLKSEDESGAEPVEWPTDRAREREMAFTLRSVKVPPNSVNLEEARSRVFDFFRTACRSIPTIMDIYSLDDVVSKSQLRSTIASEIRKNARITNPKVPLLRK